MTATPKKPRWFQFRLRTLLVLILAISCGLGWLAYHLQVARNRQRAIAECSDAGFFVYQYEPTALGKMLRRWPVVDGWVQKTFGDSMLMTPSAVSALYLPAEQVDFLSQRLMQFPALKTLHLVDVDRKDAGRLQEEFPQVDLELEIYK